MSDLINEKRADNKMLLWVAIALLPGSVLYHGLVFMLMWRWFVVPVGVIDISFMQATGLAYFIWYFARGNDILRTGIKKDEDVYVAIGKAIVSPLFVLLIGFFIQLFI